MDRRMKSLDNKLAILSSLPSESLPAKPVIELLGYRRVFVENHKGVAEYGCHRIVINVGYGQICITGTGLELAEMTRTGLVITGIIDSVSIIRKAR